MVARRSLYRLWQFWQSASARPLSAPARAEIGRLLNPVEQRLFERLKRSDQRHSYRVMQALQAAGHGRPELLKAALLHDVGKTRVRGAAWDRVAVVLGQAFWPRRTAQWAGGQPHGWRRPFAVKARHPEWGAEMAAAAGSPALTVRLIRRHQELLPVAEAGEEARLLRLLQAVDDNN